MEIWGKYLKHLAHVPYLSNCHLPKILPILGEVKVLHKLKILELTQSLNNIELLALQLLPFSHNGQKRVEHPVGNQQTFII